MERRLQFKCENKKCKKYDQELDLWVETDAIHEQVCEECGEKIIRVWGFAGTIRTGDGLK